MICRIFESEQTSSVSKIDGSAASLGNRLNIQTRELVDGALLLRVRGEVDIESAATLERALHSAESAQPRQILLDLAALEFIDSTGISVLVRARQRASCQNCSVVLANLPPQVRRVLEVSGVASQFTIA